MAVGAVPTAWAAEPVGSPRTPYPGITYTGWREANGPVAIHVVEVDLSSQEIDLVATAPEQRGSTPSAFAAVIGAKAAINGDYFRPRGFAPAGLARGQSMTWAGSEDDGRSGFLAFYKDVNGTRVSLSRPEEIVDTVEERTVGIVGGRPLLVQDGSPLTSFSCDDAVSMACDAAPRTAIALSDDGRTLWLVVVDGWQADSIGMTAAQLARFLAIDLRVDRALMLDGGSASAMMLDGELVSAPSDGVERPVANHLAVRHGSLPLGTIKGVVKERNVETGASIAGATVTIDDGRTTTYDGDELWLFEVAPRWVCVTGSAVGYHSNTTCRQVTSAQETYASIALFPDADFIDAGPDDADASPPASSSDAAPPADAAPADERPDAGTGGGGDGGGGCALSSRAGAGQIGALFLAGFFFIRLRPRAARSRYR